MDTQSSTLLLESSWHPTNILDPVDSVSRDRDCGEDQFIENKDQVKILNKV